MKINRYKMLILLLALLLVACSGGSDSGTDVPTTPADGTSVLNIYVYAPGQAVPTRGNTGQVDADPTAEDAIHTLQIWVYTHEETPTLVTYFKTNAFQQTPTVCVGQCNHQQLRLELRRAHVQEYFGSCRA